MHTTVEFIDAAKARLQPPTDYQLARHLGISPNRVSNWRTGRNTFDEEIAVKIAELIERDPGYVLTCIAAERSTRVAVKRAWQSAAKKIGAAVVTILAAVVAVQFAAGWEAGELLLINALALPALNTSYTLCALALIVAATLVYRMRSRAGAALLLLLPLAGCATLAPTSQDTHRIEWVQLEHPQLAEACAQYVGEGTKMRRVVDPAIEGCFKRGPDRCTVYTLPARGPEDETVHRTLGHEVRHCFEGLFH